VAVGHDVIDAFRHSPHPFVVVRNSRPTLPLLIVEDHDETRTALVRLLHLEGYSVVAMKDGEAALEYLRHGGPVALIVLDLQMPRVDGWVLRTRLLEEPTLAKIPVVVFSARAAGNLPDVAYVNKNDPAALLDLIERQSRPTRLAAR
jgi:CheY-like chemotaxis protein